MILPGVPAPQFPLSDGFFFGWDGHAKKASNYPSMGLTRWQSRMETRGWYIRPDGLYGPKTNLVVIEFQKEKNLVVDGRIGCITWAAVWTFPMIDRRETDGKYTIWR